MELFLCLLAAAAAIVTALLLRRAAGRRAADKELVRRVRTTDLYGYVYPFLRKLSERGKGIEQIIVRPDCLIVRLLFEQGEPHKLTYSDHGLDPAEGEVLRGLALALPSDLPELGNPRRYLFSPQEEKLMTEMPRRWYEYTIQPAFKDHIARKDFLY